MIPYGIYAVLSIQYCSEDSLSRCCIYRERQGTAPGSASAIEISHVFHFICFFLIKKL